MPGMLQAVIHGHREAEFFRFSAECPAGGSFHVFCCLFIKFPDPDDPTLPLIEGSQCRTFSSPEDRVPLPVSYSLPHSNGRGSFADVDPVWDERSAGSSSCLFPSSVVPAGQVFPEPEPFVSRPFAVDVLVNAFRADLLVMSFLQFPADDLRTPAYLQMLMNVGVDERIFEGVGSFRLPPPFFIFHLRPIGKVMLFFLGAVVESPLHDGLIPFYLPAHGGWRTVDDFRYLALQVSGL